MAKLLSALVCICLLTPSAFANPINHKAEIATEFIILHNNDMHARFEQTSVSSGQCSPEDAKANKCYGGFARVAHELRAYREEAKNGGLPVFYLNAGDTYTGTPWFAIFKDNITAAFLNKLKPDAVSLGNHEFDENVAGLVPFLNKAEFPVLACNLDLRKVPEIASAKSFAKSTILEVNGVKIGVIGYLTPETKTLATANDVEYYPEIESINAEAKEIKAQGINIIIALGHSGYQKDMEIAKSCPEVDIVIGGHTNTFLYNGKQPDAERIDGPYPTVIKQPSGKEVPVVQAYAYTKYLGKLHVQFDKDGNLIEFDGSPILLNATIPRDDDILELLEVYRPNITALESDSVGYTKVLLEGRSEICRSMECNLGNLVADSMILARVLEDQGGSFWTDAPIAFVQGGAIRSSIEKRGNGSVTASDIITVISNENALYVTKITGKTIRNALEHSATMRSKDSNGAFLQMSGIRVEYDFDLAEGNRVISVEVRCAECAVPTYAELVDSHTYSVIVDSYLLDGGDGHVFQEASNPQTIRMQLTNREALTQYFQKRQFVYPELEGRIEFRGAAGVVFGSIVLVMISALFTRIFN